MPRAMVTALLHTEPGLRDRKTQGSPVPGLGSGLVGVLVAACHCVGLHLHCHDNSRQCRGTTQICMSNPARHPWVGGGTVGSPGASGL